MTRILIVAVLFLLSNYVRGATFRVVDAAGQPVKNFEAMWHTAEYGHGDWSKEKDGAWLESLNEKGPVIDVVIRAEGYASAFRRFEKKSLQALLNGEAATITLYRGREVRLIPHLPKGMTLPNELQIQSYLPTYQSWAWLTWPPDNRRALRERGVLRSDFNLLNIRQQDDGTFTVQLPESASDFFLAFEHAGWLRFHEIGPLGEADIVNDRLPFAISTPVTVNITFDGPSLDSADCPFESVSCVVHRDMDGSGRVFQVTDRGTVIDSEHPLVLNDLGPGRYSVTVGTKAKPSVGDDPDTGINPGSFRAKQIINPTSGDVVNVQIQWFPFSPALSRGQANAKIKILNPDGSIPVGAPVEVSWYDGHYGHHVLYQGNMPANGAIELNNVSTQKRKDLDFGPFTVSVNQKRIGFFQLEDKTKVQEITLRIRPEAGDAAPDIVLTDPATKSTQRLSDSRGQVVLLEFWGVGCFFCRPAMDKLNSLVLENEINWQDKVVVLGVNIDNRTDNVLKFLNSRSWTAFPQLLATRSDGAEFSEAEKAYSIYSLPQAVLIDQKGTIVWRGNPIHDEGGMSIEDRINALISE